MKHGRSEALAFPLRTGKILVVGGRDKQNALSSCELYDPLTNTWSDAAPLNIARFRSRGSLTDDGKVFIAGGLLTPGTSITPTTNTCELYDPSTNTWKLTATMSSRREGFLACAIPGNKIALMAGLDANTPEYTRTFDIFDAATETITSMPTMPSCTAATTAIYDPAMNSIIVVGGLGEGYGGYIWKTVQCFSLTTRTWSLLDSLHVPLAQPYAVVLNPRNSSLVVFPSSVDYNGNGTTEVQVIDPDGHIRVPDHTTPRVVPIGVSTGDSALFLSGIVVGPKVWDETLLATCEWYDFKTERMSPGPTLKEEMKDEASVYYHTADSASPCSETRAIFVFGGVTYDGFTNNCEALVWSTAAGFDPPQLSFVATACSGIDTTLTLVNRGCEPLDLCAHNPNTLINWSDTTVTVAPGDSVRLSVHGSGFSGNGTYKLPVHLTQYGKSWDTSVTVTVTYIDGTRTAVHAVLRDKLGVHPGDTVLMPLYLLTPLSTGSDLRLGFEYNTDMLQMLEPSFDGAANTANVLYDLKERPGHATLDFPGTINFSSSIPFIVLRFRALLTDTTSSHVTLNSLTLGSDATTGCVALDTRSALITESLDCTERPLYQYLRNNLPGALRVTTSHGRLSITIGETERGGTLSLFDALGRAVYESTIGQAESRKEIALGDLQSGFYTVVFRNGAVTRTTRFVTQQ